MVEVSQMFESMPLITLNEMEISKEQ
jgi:hypothetical protein